MSKHSSTPIEQIMYPPASLSHSNFVKARCFFALILWQRLHPDDRITAHEWAQLAGVKQGSLYSLSKRWFDWKYVTIYGNTHSRPGPRNFSYALAARGDDYFRDMAAWYPYRSIAAAKVFENSNITLWWQQRNGVAWITYPWSKPEHYHFSTITEEMKGVVTGLMSHEAKGQYSQARFLAMMLGRSVGHELDDFMKAQGLYTERKPESSKLAQPKTQPKTYWDARAQQLKQRHEQQGSDDEY